MKRLKDDSEQASVVTALCRNQGQALIEYILVLPLVFLLLVNVVNFGGFFYAFITVANASRAAADFAILGGATVASGHIAQPGSTDITNLITTEIASLPNNPSLSVNICQRNGATVTALSGTCSSIPTDPEAASYVLTSIDVTYTYVPFIPLFSFPNMNIYATIPPTTIHRRAVMRTMQ
jgi:Flp pilus assembly protein TadG